MLKDSASLDLNVSEIETRYANTTFTQTTNTDVGIGFGVTSFKGSIDKSEIKIHTIMRISYEQAVILRDSLNNILNKKQK